MTNLLKLITTTLFLALLSATTSAGNYKVYKAEKAPVIDGVGNEYCWSKAQWALINQPFDGLSLPAAADFSGRYKVVWTDTRLYILMEITDDKLVDNRMNPTENYWDDDCTEFFIDEDHKAEGHECGTTAFNAFAYHIAAVAREKEYYSDGEIVSFDAPNAIHHVVDLGTNCNTNYALNLDDHVNVKIKQDGTKYTWELEFKIFTKSYNENSTTNTPVTLTANKVMGFAIAYCDDDNGVRNNMVGTVPNHNDYSGQYPFYRFTNEYGTLTLSDSVLTDPGTVSVIEKTPASQYIQLSPNPVANTLNVKLTRESGKTDLVEIVNLSGQTVLSQKNVNNDFSINVSGLPSGIYFVQTNVSGLLRKQKFIKK